MKRLLLIGFLCLTACAITSAEILVNGVPIDIVTKSMADAGYSKTGLDIEPVSGDDLEFWQVGQGILIVNCDTRTRRVRSLTFWLADERPKASRREFEFDVASFDTTRGFVTMRATNRRNPGNVEP